MIAKLPEASWHRRGLKYFSLLIRPACPARDRSPLSMQSSTPFRHRRLAFIIVASRVVPYGQCGESILGRHVYGTVCVAAVPHVLETKWPIDNAATFWPVLKRVCRERGVGGGAK